MLDGQLAVASACLSGPCYAESGQLQLETAENDAQSKQLQLDA